MTTFKTFLQESINDNGIFKAVFVLGLPGAGKTYTIRKLQGVVSPRIVSTDRASEHLSKQMKTVIDRDTWGEFEDRSKKITRESLSNYINGMLPLFIDGTSNDVSNILQRMGILESLGYDVGIVYINSPLDLAIKRAEERAEKIGRYVDREFIVSTMEKTDSNIQFLKSRVGFFKEIKKDGLELSNDVLQDAFKKVQNFYSQPIKNPIGNRIVAELREKKQSYMSPGIMTKEVLDKKIQSWYK